MVFSDEKTFGQKIVVVFDEMPGKVVNLMSVNSDDSFMKAKFIDINKAWIVKFEINDMPIEDIMNVEKFSDAVRLFFSRWFNWKVVKIAYEEDLLWRKKGANRRHALVK